MMPEDNSRRPAARLRFSRLGLKLFVSFLCMAAVTIGVLWLIQAGLLRDSSLKARLGAVKAGMESAVAQATSDWSGVEEDLNVTILLFDHNGSLQSMMQGMPRMGAIVRACQAMIPNQVDGEARLASSASGSGRTALLGFRLPGQGYAFAVFSIADLDESARLLREQLWLITLILVLTAVVLALALSRRFARPIRAVTTAARDLARGNYSIVLPVMGRDEIGELTTALNELASELQITENLRKELIANVSHELRSPLAVIQGYAETVRDVTWPDESKRREQLGIVSAEAARLSRIVGDILDYSRLQAGAEKISPSAFAVRPVLDDLLKRYALAAEQRQIRLRCRCEDISIFFDRDKFDQVMGNLLANALNHADPDTAVVINAANRGGVTRIEVCNQGDTIPAAERERIWDRYYRAPHEQENRPLGSGLGLAIVRSLLERHQADFGIDSEDRETIFWFEVYSTPKRESESRQ